jgi:plastocyanin
LAALVLAACGGGGGGGGGYTTSPGNPGGNPGGGNNSAPNTVVLTANAFSPTSLTVAVNTTVTWNWNSCNDTGGYGGGYDSCVAHNITFDDGSNISSGSQSTGTFSRTFSAAGTYKYHCSIHGSAMSGQIVVQ